VNWQERLDNDAQHLTLEQRRTAMPQTAEIVGWFQAEFGKLKRVEAKEGKWFYIWEAK
jgi:hypothetical protein